MELTCSDPVNTERKLKVHKTFGRRPGRLMYVEFTPCICGGVDFRTQLHWLIDVLESILSRNIVYLVKLP